MILRDCLVRGGIVDSVRVCALKPATQLFFRNILHVCDGAARFDADADRLRTVLYGRVLSRVSRGDVARWMVECHQAGLIKLYTRDGRGYGRVVNYGQRDTKRKVLYPGEERDGLFATGSPGEESGDPPRSHQGEAGFFAPADPDLNRIEGKGRGAKRPAPKIQPETQEAWLARLRTAHPHLDLDAQLRAAKRYCDKQLKKLDRKFFEEVWLANIGEEVTFPDHSQGGTAPGGLMEPEPEGWQKYLQDEYEGETWAETAALYPWSGLPENWRRKIAREMRRAG